MTKKGWARLFWFVHMLKKRKKKNTQFTFGQSAFMGSLLCEGFVCLQPFGSQVLHYEVQVETALQGNWAKLNRTLHNHFLMAFFFMDKSENSSGMWPPHHQFFQKETVAFSFISPMTIGGGGSRWAKCVIFSSSHLLTFLEVGIQEIYIH